MSSVIYTLILGYKLADVIPPPQKKENINPNLPTQNVRINDWFQQLQHIFNDFFAPAPRTLAE